MCHAVKTVKALLVTLVALLALSMLSTPVSALAPKYYAARFVIDANGQCEVYEYGVGTFPGRGRVKIRGLAIAQQEADHYWSYAPDDPNTRVWTHRSLMKVNWDNSMLVAYIWPSSTTLWLWDNEGNLEIEYLGFTGYLKNSSNRVQLIWGKADIGFYNEIHLQFISVYILKGPELYLDFDFTWYHDEAQAVRHTVTVWPIK